MNEQTYIAVEPAAPVAEHVPPNHASYSLFSKRVQDTVDTNRAGIHGAAVYMTTVTRQQIKEAYLNGFAETARQYHRCQTCLSAIADIGRLVVIDQDGKTHALAWNENIVDIYYHASVKAMRELVEAAPIERVYFSKQTDYGVHEKGGFDHMNLVVDINAYHPVKSDGSVSRETMQDFTMLQTVVYAMPAVTIRDMITFFQKDTDLRNYPELRHTIGQMFDLQSKLATMSSEQAAEKRNLLWKVIATNKKGLIHFGDTVLGKFAENVTTGGDTWEVAKKKFIAMVDPKFFRRPQVEASAGNIEVGEKMIEKMGLATALERRLVIMEDIPEFTWLPKVDAEPKAPVGVFAKLKPKVARTTAKASTLSGTIIDGGVTAWDRLMERHLLDADEIYITLAPRYKYGVAGMTTAQHPDAKPIMKWDSIEKRNPVTAFSPQDGRTTKEIGVEAEIPLRVIGIVRHPREWNTDTKPLPTDMMIVLLEGAKILDMKSSVLFPDDLLPELREIRRTIEQFSNETDMPEEPDHVAGLVLGGEGHPLALRVRIVKDGISTAYGVDRTS
jgi:hypothetical protein